MPVSAKNIIFYSLQLRARVLFCKLLQSFAKPVPMLPLCLLLIVDFSNHAWASSVDQSVAVFSTYPSEDLLETCIEQRETNNLELDFVSDSTLCQEDAVSPENFIKELSEAGKFNNLLSYAEGNDYELLIANVGAAPNVHKQNAKQFAEFTLQWRGIEIDSSAFDSGIKTSDSNVIEKQSTENVARLLVSRWLEHVKHKQIFTSEFLFAALEASNYNLALQVPDAIGDFTKLDTQLFSDPFSGAITRYIHPNFEDALVDVTVYPFLAQLSSDESELLPQELESDLKKASATAELQHLMLSQVSPASPYTVNDKLSGWRLGLSANSETSPTIFATTYVFRQQDKIVKVSTTFPPDFSDTIVNQLIVKVQVPRESEMMKKVRTLLLESQR